MGTQYPFCSADMAVTVKVSFVVKFRESGIERCQISSQCLDASNATINALYTRLCVWR